MRLLALAHPGLLWTGLGLAAVPILIHLFFRRRHRVLRWAAMTFLLAALRKQKRRIEVENLILLLVRCALIVLLALAVARPSVRAASLNPFGGGARSTVLVLDTSASMGARHTGRTALDRAKERAARLLSELPRGSLVTLLTTRDDATGGGPRAVLENASPAEARTRLAALRPARGGQRLGEVVRLVGRKLTAMRGRRMAVFLTDLQRRDWIAEKAAEKAGRGGRREDLFAALMLLDGGEPGGKAKRPPVVVMDVGLEQAANVVVRDLAVDEGREAFSPSLLWLSASLVNYGPAPAAGTLILYRGRPGEARWEKRETRRVTIEPTVGIGGPAVTSVTLHQMLEAGSEGPARFKVVFEPTSGAADRLVEDDRRFLALRVRPPVRMLPVRSVPGALVNLKDMDEAIEVVKFADPIYPSELGRYDLSRVDVVLWADAEVHDLEPAGAARLERFVKRGGGLLAYLGTYAQPGRVNTLFFKEKGQGLFPMLLADEGMHIDEDHPVSIDVLDEQTQRQPLFRDTEKAALFYSPEILGFRRVAGEFLRDPEFVRRHVVAHYDTPAKDPAVLRHRLGRGRIVIVTTTPDERAVRLNGSLLPLVLFFNAAHLLVRDDPSSRNVLVGAPVTIPLPPGARKVVIEPPEEAGGRSEEPVADPEKPFLLEETAFPGFYRITIQGVDSSGAAALPFTERHVAAVNVEAGEGDLRRITPAAILRQYRGTSLRFADRAENVLPEAVAGAGEGELSRALLGGVAFLLLLELALAWRFGSRRRSA